MTISEIKKMLFLTELTEVDDNREVTGCYIGDLLSWVMSKAQSGDIWITIMTNVNIVAVATLTDVACIIVCENADIDSATIEKAKQQGISLFKSDLTAYELASKINELKIF